MTEDDVLVPGAPSELEVLKSRASMMGIPFSNNIKLETLRARVEAKMDGEEDPHPEPEVDLPDTTGDAAAQDELPTPGKGVAPPAPTKPLSKREQIDAVRETQMKDQMRLVRLRITNMDPKKKELHGEIITFANDFIGTVRKFIPFGEVTDDGYHVPYCLYQMMKERKFLDIRTTKKNGQIQVSQRWANEFALEELPPLTQDEINKLAAAQTAAGTFSNAGLE